MCSPILAMDATGSMTEKIRGYLTVSVAEASGKNKEDDIVWDGNFVEGFVKGQSSSMPSACCMCTKDKVAACRCLSGGLCHAKLGCKHLGRQVAVHSVRTSCQLLGCLHALFCLLGHGMRPARNGMVLCPVHCMSRSPVLPPGHSCRHDCTRHSR